MQQPTEHEQQTIFQSQPAEMSWRTLIDTSIARSRKVRGGNYVQIATVAEGKPRCRTVVFRGFLELEGRESLRMITDARSEKAKQIAASPWCEMVYWFGKSSEQYRIQGTLQLIGEEEQNSELLSARKQQWGNLTDSGREQFFWNDPGLPFEGDPSTPAGGRGEDNRVLPPPPSFLLMLLWPTEVKFLRLTDNYAQQDIIDETGKWMSDRANP